MSRIIQIPEDFFKQIAVKDKLYSRIWFYWFTNSLDEIFEPDFIEKQQKLYPSINLEIVEIYNFGIQLLQQDFKIIDKKKRKEYDKKITEMAEKVLDYLNDKAGTSFMYKKSNTDIISARISEGFVLSDFYIVIDKKTQDWKGTDWAKYLRPLTLFNKSKFENYLNGASTTTTTSNKVSKFAESISKAKQIMGLHKDE
jgi:uncharacterized phage protein (TIGR02220 family)